MKYLSLIYIIFKKNSILYNIMNKRYSDFDHIKKKSFNQNNNGFSKYANNTQKTANANFGHVASDPTIDINNNDFINIILSLNLQRRHLICSNSIKSFDTTSSILVLKKSEYEQIKNKLPQNTFAIVATISSDQRPILTKNIFNNTTDNQYKNIIRIAINNMTCALTVFLQNYGMPIYDVKSDLDNLMDVYNGVKLKVELYQGKMHYNTWLVKINKTTNNLQGMELFTFIKH
jgi:hypothetical protein